MNHPQHYRHFTRESFDHLSEDFGFQIISVTLRGTTETRLKRLREWLPFRRILSYVLNNMYDDVHFALQKPSPIAHR